jgi:hypothetical protein
VTQVAGSAANLLAVEGTVWVLNSASHLYRWDGSNWSLFRSDVSAISTDSGGQLDALWTDHYAHQYDGNQSWHTVSNFVIVPKFDGSITNDAHDAAVENKINQAILAYETKLTNAITVRILFKEDATISLGQSSNVTDYQVAYTTYLDLLRAHATGAAATALANLPAGPNNPVTGDPNIILTRANYLALGGNPGATTDGYDGTISINTGITDAAGPGSTLYSLTAVAEHEIDEVLGLGSALHNLHNGDPAPTGAVYALDLYRYDQNGHRSFDTGLSTQAYFSIDGGKTLLARFNQSSRGDFSDWYSTGTHTAQVQDAFQTPGVTPTLGVELTALNVLGYNLI